MKKDSKKKNPITFIIKCLLFCILSIFLFLAGLFAFSALDRKDSVSVIPKDYSIYLHTDSAWDSLVPLLDLQAADILLSSEPLVQFRGLFMNLRSSNLRSSKLLDFLASRPVTAMFYSEEEFSAKFVAVANLGFLSAITRSLPLFEFALPKQIIAVNNHYEYKLKDSTIYIKPVKNLLVVSNSLDYLKAATEVDNSKFYSEEEKEFLLKKNDKSIRLIADSYNLANNFTAENEILKPITSVLAKNQLSEVSFEITDETIKLKAELPFEASINSESAFYSLIKKESSLPTILTRLGDVVQYYTTINAGTFEELKEALFPLIPANKNADALWKKANSMCNVLFSSSIEDLIFSWTGKEFAALGIRGHNDPVFAIQVKDEVQRELMFEQIFSSILIKNNDSLILNGVRLPQLILPGFLNSVLSLFNINIPFPYYVEYDGFIYFSESPECLCELINSMKGENKLSKTDNWKEVSSEQKAESTLSLFYDLEQSMPFFLRGKSVFSEVLKLYSIGRCDIRINNCNLEFQLQAIARRAGDLRSIPGFPINLDETAKLEYILSTSNEKSPELVFWLENSKTIKALNVSSTQVFSFEMPEECCIKAAPQELANNGVLWAVTKNGAIYLFNNKLIPLKRFPILSGEKSVGLITATDSKLVMPLENGNILFVDSEGYIFTEEIEPMGKLRAVPVALENNFALYYKGFIGEILFFEDGVCKNPDSAELIDGIAFGAPATLKSNGNVYTAFITQNGMLYIWENGVQVSNKIIKLQNTFNSNVVASNSNFYALGVDSTVYKISIDGSFMSVKIPDCTAKNGYICVAKNFRKDNCGVFVCPDSNVLYGFTEGLELISGFPLVGYGIPAFADVNGDKSLDCITLSIDNKLNAWNLR